MFKKCPFDRELFWQLVGRALLCELPLIVMIKDDLFKFATQEQYIVPKAISITGVFIVLSCLIIVTLLPVLLWHLSFIRRISLKGKFQLMIHEQAVEQYGILDSAAHFMSIIWRMLIILIPVSFVFAYTVGFHPNMVFSFEHKAGSLMFAFKWLFCLFFSNGLAVFWMMQTKKTGRWIKRALKDV